MPLRTVLILSGLFAFCLAIPVIAWLVGSDFYVLVPAGKSRGLWHPINRPPTHPLEPLLLLFACAALWFYLPRYGLGLLAGFTFSIFLGTLVGWGVFQWTPTISQHILSVGLITLLGYGWSILELVE